MSPTVIGAVRTVATPESGGTLIADFQASVDFGTPSLTVGSNFNVVKNGVRLYNKGTAQVWPVAHPTAPGITYEGGSHVFRINMSSGGANEIRFDNLPAVDDMFTEWWLYQPSGTETPFVGIVPVSGSSDGSGNDKLFRLWSVSYTEGMKAGGSYWHAAPGSVGYAGSEFTLYQASTNKLLGMGEGGSFYGSNNRQPQPSGFMGAAAYVGRWVRVRFRCKPATGPLDNNGIIQIWLDDTLIVNRVNLPLYTNGTHPNSWTNGYIMGAKNSGGNGAQVYIDNVRFSTGGFV